MIVLVEEAVRELRFGDREPGTGRSDDFFLNAIGERLDSFSVGGFGFSEANDNFGETKRENQARKPFRYQRIPGRVNLRLNVFFPPTNIFDTRRVIPSLLRSEIQNLQQKSV
jgi:hypothetical protein